MRTLARRAKHAVAVQDWEAAAASYATMLHRKPYRVELRVQLGHCLKEAGKTEEAADAYESAAADVRADDHNVADAAFHLGLLRLGQGLEDSAIVALNRALRHEPLHAGALEALWHARLLLRLPSDTLALVRNALAEDIGEREAALEEARARFAAADRHPGSDYASFRPRMTLAPPSYAPAHHLMEIVIDARGSAPAFIRATVESLFKQSLVSWRAEVHVDKDGALHPVASLAALDPRLRFISPSVVSATEDETGFSVYLSAGSRLDPEALAWLSYGLNLPDAGALTCDWDWCLHRWDGPLIHADPELNGLFDLDRLLAADTPPPLLAFRKRPFEGPLSGEGRRRAVARLAMEEPIGHVPLPLIAIGGITERAKIAPENGENIPLWSQPRSPTREFSGLPLEMTLRDGRPPLTCGPLLNSEERIRIIIPTRDCVGDLTIAVDSLLATAQRPELLTFCLIDNCSVEPETAAYLLAAAKRNHFEVWTHEAPFNWSAINNRGAESGDEPILLMANNDIRMMSLGWDVRLRAQLQRDDVGAVGARLLYPDGCIQHAGIVFGVHEGAPQHEGVRVELSSAEIDHRFDRSQACSAVTGAFLGVRRKVFEAVGKLDALRFIIAYNDIDFCLSLRSFGLSILYDPGIEAIHFESRTRGLNDSRSRVAWDQEELRALYAKWGDALLKEPGLSPWWAQDARYAALRQQTSDDIANHLRCGLAYRWRPHKNRV